MGATSRRGQLALEWDGVVQWSELPASAQREIRALLRELLWHVAYDDGQPEGTPDE
jgi:hypothetical protein